MKCLGPLVYPLASLERHQLIARRAQLKKAIRTLYRDELDGGRKTMSMTQMNYLEELQNKLMTIDGYRDESGNFVPGLLKLRGVKSGDRYEPCNADLSSVVSGAPRDGALHTVTCPSCRRKVRVRKL